MAGSHITSSELERHGAVVVPNFQGWGPGPATWRGSVGVTVLTTSRSQRFSGVLL